MGSIGRYIFRTTFGAFLLVLISLTAAIWLTQALRDVDLMTGQGQTILAFLGITSLIVPQLVTVIAAAHILHKLATDSEIIVMNGAGMRPWRLLTPFIVVTILGSILISTISSYVAPESLRLLRRWISEVRADLVSNIVQPGRVTAIEQGLAFYIRERRPHGSRHHRGRTRRDGEERKRQLLAAAKRQHSAVRGEAARPEHCRVRPLRLRP